MADLLVNNPQWQQFAASLEQDRGLTSGLLSAVLRNESAGGHPDYINATSSAGAQGAFQFMPATAKQYNVNVSDTADSTRGAADMLGDLTRKYRDPLLAGAAYNWGEGNLDKAIAAAQKQGLPTDALGLASRGLLPNETSSYVQRLAANLGGGAQPKQFSPDLINATQTGVVQSVMQGLTPTAIVHELSRSPVAAMIQQLKGSGLSNDEIVKQVGGTPLAQAQAAQAQVDKQSFLTNLKHGASNALSDMGAGAKQIGARVLGDDEKLKALQAQQAAIESDPTRQAQDNTVGSMVGNAGVKAVPFIAGSIVAPEATLPMLALNAGIGGVEGALKPTTGDDQFLSNIATEGGLGAAGAGLGHYVGAGLGKVARGLGGDAEATARLASAQSQGLPASVSSVAGPNSFWRGLAEAAPDSGAAVRFQQQADQAIASKVADGLGLQKYAGPIDHNMLDAATPNIKAALDNATSVKVTLPTTLRADLDTLMAQGTNPLTKGIATNAVARQAAENLSAAADAGMPVAGQDLQGLASELKQLLYGTTASHSEKQVASRLVTKINDTLTGAMSPQQQAAYQAANAQYRNLLAVQKMVRATNDTGVVTPRAMLQAAKNGSFKNAFLQGEAPFQDLASVAGDLYGPSANKGLGSVISKAVGGHDQGLSAAAVLEPHSGIPALAAKKLAGAVLSRLAASQNPTAIRLLTGAGRKPVDPALASYISKALSGTGAAGTTEL